MADTYLRCNECAKKLKTFQALVKHFERSHVNKPIPKRAVFFHDDEEVQLMTAQAIRSPAVQGEYKTWLAGVVERLNGIHHQRHKRKFTLVTNRWIIDCGNAKVVRKTVRLSRGKPHV